MKPVIDVNEVANLKKRLSKIRKLGYNVIWKDGEKVLTPDPSAVKDYELAGLSNDWFLQIVLCPEKFVDC